MPELFACLQLAFNAIDVEQQHAVGILGNGVDAIICVMCCKRYQIGKCCF